MRLLTAGSAILVAIYVSACSGKSASDDDDNGGNAGDSSGSGKGGSGGNTGAILGGTGGTSNVGKGGGSVGGTGGTNILGKGGGSVGGTGGGSLGGTGGGSLGGTGGSILGGGGSTALPDVPSSAYLDELTPDQLHALCVWGVALEGGPGEKQCENSVTVTTETVEQCSTDTVTIHCTVGMLESCFLSLNGDVCAILTTDACATYIDCALNG